MTEAPLSWQYRPTTQPYYINSVATSAKGERVVTGTFYHSYSESRRPTMDGSNGRFGTYLLGGQGNLIWKDEFDGYEGVYWVAITPTADFVASCGWYSNAPYQGFVFIYDAASGQQLVKFTGTTSRVSICAFAASGDALVAGGAQVFSFRRGSGGFDSTPLIVSWPQSNPDSADAVQGLAVDVTGSLIAVGTVQGNIFLIDTSQGTGNIVAQFNCGASVHSIAMDWVGASFIAGASGGKVYYFNVEQFKASKQPTWFQTLPGAASVYGVAMNMDGNLASAVGNVGNAGVLGVLAISSSSGQWNWTAATLHNPNSTSMSGDGGLITVADGHPDSTPGAFYLFNADNQTALWRYDTDNMSWPMQISSSGNAAVAGSDNGNVYCFAPLRVF